MGNYLKLFKTEADYEAESNKPTVSHIIELVDIEIEVPEIDTCEQYGYIDLGLPNGTLWACKNIGAATETDAGLYFQWGDIQGYADGTSKNFDWSTYKYGVKDNYDTVNRGMTKYNGTDGKTILDDSDNAAKAILGGNWDMPTSTDFCYLKDNTNYQYTSINGVSGYKFVSRTDNTKYLFIPAVGFYIGRNRYSTNECVYWYKEKSTTHIHAECNILKSTSFYCNDAANERRYGSPIRPLIRN